jgi:hypothetical protein
MRTRMVAVRTMAAFLWAGASFGAQKTETWTGKISDSSCGGSHDAMTEHGKKGTDKDCTLMCVKKGSKYVFVNGTQVLAIANQDAKGLEQFAGDTVKLTGQLRDGVITVTKIEKAK